MSRPQAIQGNRVLLAFDFHLEILVISLEYLVWTRGLPPLVASTADVDCRCGVGDEGWSMWDH